MKQKKIAIIGFIAFVILLIGAGTYFIATNRNADVTPTPQPEQKILSMKPEDIGLTISHITYTKKTPNGPGLRLEATKLEEVVELSCDIEYTHVNKNGEELREGFSCNIEIEPGEDSIRQDFPFGTCSDVCHYHKDITDIKALIKVTKKDGQIYQIEQTVPDEEE